MKRTVGARIFNVFNISILLLICLSIVFPFWQQVVISISPPDEAGKIGLHVFTGRPTFDAYSEILRNGAVVAAYYWTIIRTVLGTFLTVIVTSMLAYPLSKKYLCGRKIFMNLIVFTMFFSGGLIPTFLLVRDLGLVNKIWALVLPGLCGAYTVIVVRNFFNSLPVELEESAYIDGANDVHVFFKIVLPLSTPILATITLWSLVGHWNAWFDAMIYLNGSKITVLQTLLRKVMTEATSSAAVNSNNMDFSKMDGQQYTVESVKAAVLMVVTIPIIMVYPFLQKYFVKGIMIGSVKG